jgi:hypothetical protein
MKPRTRNTMDHIIKIIRSRGELDKIDFTILCDMSPSSFYNWKGLILRLNPDIIFEEGKYKLVKSENVSV